MAITEIPAIIPESETTFFLREWNPLVELNDESDASPTVLIYGASDAAHQAAAGMIAKLISQFPNMALFVVPETPENAEEEIDKTTEIMEWLSNTENRGLMPQVSDFNTPIPLIYLSNVNDLYTETSLVRLVRRARFLGVAVLAVASHIDPESSTFSNISGMFTHAIEV
jgi:hypothetical protein